MFYNAKTLIVVYKDEMLLNQLKKLVESNDDDANGIVGTPDNAINIVAWSEKVWLGNKKAGNIKDKVLFLGDIKGCDKLIPVVDLVINEYGVKFGWAGNQAILFVDPKVIRSTKEYLAFLDELEKMPLPEMIKNPKKIHVKKSDAEVETDIVEAEQDADNGKKGKLAFLAKAQAGVKAGIDAIGSAGEAVASKTEEVFRDKETVKKQMMFYGVVVLYKKCLNDFMNV